MKFTFPEKFAQIPTTDPYDKIEKIDFPDPYTMVVTWNETSPYACTGLAMYPNTSIAR